MINRISSVRFPVILLLPRFISRVTIARYVLRCMREIDRSFAIR